MLDNMFIYGQFTPPNYDLRKITAKVALHYSENDWLAAIVVSITCHVLYSQDESLLASSCTAALSHRMIHLQRHPTTTAVQDKHETDTPY
jgi:hypothetical protein